MRLKETKEVVEMIKRIEAGGGGGGGSDYPFPQGPKTNAYLEAGQVIEIDFAKLKTILEAKGVDLTGYITGTSVCGDKEGSIIFGTDLQSEPLATLFASYDSNVPTYFLSANVSSNYTDGIANVGEELTFGDALTAAGKVTINIMEMNEAVPIANFGNVILLDIDEADQVITLTAEEASSYISFAELPGNIIWIAPGETLTVDCTKLKQILGTKGVDLTAYFAPTSTCVVEGGKISLAFGYDDPDYEVAFVTSANAEGACMAGLIATDGNIDYTQANLSMTIAEILDLLGTRSVAITNGDGYFANFANVKVYDVYNNETDVTLTADEVSQYVTVE
jgi:hypothetical protein